MQRPHIPVWFGARADAALRRSARLGDGWMGAGGSSIAAFKEAIAKVRAHLDELGRDRAGFPLSKRVYIALDKDRKSAARKLEQWFASYYGTAEFALEVSVYGAESEVTDGLGELMRSRPDMLMLNPVYDLLEHPERLAKDVIPKL
jgi:alkanesulfonate monooxygenase SsuD/methylene tetrahydromethanopterin reductase-like flavin-dependent oxidoreductase (luciferase family)